MQTLVHQFPHYLAGERVHLRRDPSQFGTVEYAPSGALYDSESQTQMVFWKHENADICSCERIADLMNEEEYKERCPLLVRQEYGTS